MANKRTPKLPSIKDAEPTKQNFLKLYDSQLPDLMSKNIRLQNKALEVIEEKIDRADAVQAARIYQILCDKVQSYVNKSGDKSNTFNMYFGDNSMSTDDMSDLMSRVMNRMDKDSSDVVVVDAEVVNETDANDGKEQ